MMNATPAPEHDWLMALVGDWTCQAECVMGPDQPPMKTESREIVRAVGPLWIVCEGTGEMPGGESCTTRMTIGFDPDRKRFVGTWIGSMMTFLWIYEGQLDAARRVLTLETEGPKMTPEGGTARYREVIEVRSPDERTMKSSMRGDDGQWVQFLDATFRRTGAR